MIMKKKEAIWGMLNYLSGLIKSYDGESAWELSYYLGMVDGLKMVLGLHEKE